WTKEFPNYLETGKVLLEAHNFFTSQPARKVTVFLIRMVLPDWADKYVVKILRLLREAADKSTKLIIVDNILSYACKETVIPGAELPLPPAPLLPNLGHTNVIAYYTDFTMMTVLNGHERTLLQVQGLMKESGWKLIEVYYGDPFAVGQSKMIGVPI
ncbi:hypothetical protein B0H17DRAFT_956099, partial [Mycena rosella]